MAGQSHQRGESGDFCMGEVYIKYDRPIRYFGGVFINGKEKTLHTGPEFDPA